MLRSLRPVLSTSRHRGDAYKTFYNQLETNFQAMEFVNKVVIVTGSSSGIGAETAIHFAKQSAKVALIGRNEDRLNNVAKQCQQANGIEPLVFQADVTNDADINFFFFFNSRNKNPRRTVFDKIFNTNLRSVYLLTSLAVPHLIKTKGNIINISSIAATKCIPKQLVYCTSKAGLDMFTKCLAKELGPDKVRVNAISPGPVKTGIFAAAGMDSTAAIESREKSSPLGKVAVSKDIADMVLYVASEKANSITGSIFVVDNGRLLE